MIVDRTTKKGPSTSSTLGMIARGTVVALVVSVAVVVVSQWLGHPAHPGLAAAMAVVAATSYAAGQKRVGRRNRKG